MVVMDKDNADWRLRAIADMVQACHLMYNNENGSLEQSLVQTGLVEPNDFVLLRAEIMERNQCGREMNWRSAFAYLLDKHSKRGIMRDTALALYDSLLACVAKVRFIVIGTGKKVRCWCLSDFPHRFALCCRLYP